MPQANELMARRVANELLDSLNITTYPIDPEAIAAQLQIPVEETGGFPADCYGALTYVDGQFSILVSSACPTPGLRRFTLCHEIGHASIDWHTGGLEWLDQPGGIQVAVSEGGFRSRKPIEVEADHFASELLMPARWVQRYVDEQPVGMDVIRLIAERFQSSLTSAAVRYATLSPQPVLVVVSKGTTIEWITPSPEVAQADFFRYNAIRTASIPFGSATRRLAEDPAAVLGCREISSDGRLREWFPRAPAEVTVEIDSVGLGSYGRVLTLIMCSEMPDPDELYLREQGESAEELHEEDWRSEMRRDAGYHD